MFGFSNRKKRLEVQRLLRRIIDKSVPNIPLGGSDLRCDERSNRTFPALLVPYENDEPSVSETLFVVTKNLSAQGAALVLQQPFAANRALVGLWDDSHCVFLLGEVHHRTSLDAGFWQLGIELTEILTPASNRSLLSISRLAQRLVPAHESAVSAESAAL